MKNILFTAVVNVLVVLGGGISYKCNPKMNCSHCPQIDHCGKKIKCGCCNICIPTLKEDEPCISIIQMISQSPAKCAPGLLCNPHTKTCSRDHTFINEVKVKNRFPSIRPSVPDAVMCQSDSCQCYYDGIILKEYQPLKFSEITPRSCNCAVKKAKYTRVLLSGIMCTRKGSFQTLQCSGSICYCVDEDGKQRDDQERFESGRFEYNPC